MERPETRYVAVGDADVAYQVIGEGPKDLLFFYGLGSHIDLFWDNPVASRFIQRLASFCRMIIFDRRGTGASDSFARSAIPTWEEWTDDVLAVLDAAGSCQAAIFATVDSGPIAILFAAMHPERVSSLILLNVAARWLVADDYQIGASLESVDPFVEMIETMWGTNELAGVTNPSMANDTAFLDSLAKIMRASATPRMAAAQYDYILRVDVRHALPLLEMPTLVFHLREHAFISVEHGRYLADHIKGARFVALSGGDATLTPDNDVIADEIIEFVTGERPAVEVERILTTVLFSDIAGSTSRAATLGDRRWRLLLDAHDHAVRDQIQRFRGREVNTTGDGFVVSFDGPARAINCAQALVDATANLGIDIRIGLHTGECEVRGDDLGGLAVHIAARVVALAGPGEILVSSTVKDLVVGSGIEFADRGEHDLKGVPESWRLFAVAG